MNMLHRACAILLALTATAAYGQTVTLPQVKNAGGSNVPSGAAVLTDSSGIEKGTAANPLAVATNGKQETFALVTANAPATAATTYGGSYVVSQSCATYGTVTVRYRGPDGATMLTMLTKTSADSTGGTLVSLASSAIVDATVSGTTGCNVTLARVP